MQAVGSLNYHKTNTHADKTVQDFKCGECDFKSYAKRYVLSHIRKVHRGLNYKHVCEHCGDKFAYPSDLKSHTVIIPSELSNKVFRSDFQKAKVKHCQIYIFFFNHSLICNGKNDFKIQFWKG